MSVNHVIDRVKAGHGRGLTALALAQAQREAGWQVRLLVSGVRDAHLLPRVPPATALLGDSAIDVYRRVDKIQTVSDALERHTSPGDIVVCHEGVDLAAACHLSGRWIVAAVHSSPDACLAYLPPAELTNLVNRTDRWIAWGGAVANRLTNLLKVDPRKITVSAQAVDFAAVRPRTLAGSPAILTAARIHPVKNHALMLQTLPLLVRRWPAVHWHMAGAGDDAAYWDQMRTFAVQLGVSEHVTWHGYVCDAAAMITGSHVTILASHSEGVPRVIQEAMVLRVPTVIPAPLGAELHHSGLPVRFAPNDPGALSEAIAAALRVGSDRLSAASDWVTRTWSWARVLRDWAVAFEPAGCSGISAGPQIVSRVQ